MSTDKYRKAKCREINGKKQNVDSKMSTDKCRQKKH